MLSLSVSGCKTASYSASTLPPELVAQPVQNVRDIDLSRFSGPLYNAGLIDRGDRLRISLAAGLTAESIVEFPVRVHNDGTVNLPEIGPLSLAGMDLMGAEQTITAACIQRGLYRQPNVTVSMEEQRMNRITVRGAVDEPGVHEIPRTSSYLMSAIVAAGGLEENAGAKVSIRRPTSASRLAGADRFLPGGSEVNQVTGLQNQTTLVCFNMDDETSAMRESSYLPDGSVVTIEEQLPDPIEVIGLVKSPGQHDFPLSNDIRVLSAVSLAGGVSSLMADEIVIIRRLPGEEGTTTIEVSVSKAKHSPGENIRLAPGDIVSVEQSPATILLEALRLIRVGVGMNAPLW